MCWDGRKTVPLARTGVRADKYEEQSAGWKEVQWNAVAFSSGIYLCHLVAGEKKEIKKNGID